MRENNIIRKQQLQNMVYNMIAFSVIFVVFGAIIFSQIKASIYTRLDSELRNSLRNMTMFIADRNPDFASMPGMEARPRENEFTNIRSPRIIPLLRDNTGKVINFGNVSSSYYEQYLKYLVFDRENLDTVVPISISNQYHFRSITTRVETDNGEEIYMQLVINSDGENALLQHISVILFTFIAVFGILSVLASFILSQTTMKPVKIAWNKQVEFVQNVSHELRTPLTIIQNSLEMLLTSPNEKIIDRSEGIALALNETTRLSKLVTDLLTLARSDSTMTVINKDLFSLDILVKTVCQPYSELSESQNKHFEVNLQCPMNINADRGRIHQLLAILLDNALKYTDENDSISVSTSIMDNRACIIVADTGIGISDQAMGKIFDRFYREDKARFREREGMGLGLSIAGWIVDKHGGTIKATHNAPRGTIFSVRLPK